MPVLLLEWRSRYSVLGLSVLCMHLSSYTNSLLMLIYCLTNCLWEFH